MVVYVERAGVLAAIKKLELDAEARMKEAIAKHRWSVAAEQEAFKNGLGLAHSVVAVATVIRSEEDESA